MTLSTQDDIKKLSLRLDAIAIDELSCSEFTTYHYAKSMLNRLSKQQEDITPSKLPDKVFQALETLAVSQESRRIDAQSLIETIELKYPDSYDKAKSHFEAKSYAELRTFYLSLKRNTVTACFKELISNMHTVELKLPCDTPYQEGQQQRLNSTKPSELKSFKQYQVMFEKMALDRLLSRVMKEIPENAGPLNPERLVIRSFQALQDISPDYLARLISYYESLLTLQLLSNVDR